MIYKPGDEVRIIARPVDGESSSPTWPPEMDSTLGKCGRVMHLFNDRVCVGFKYTSWYYSYEWIEPVNTVNGHYPNNRHMTQELPQ